MFTNAQITIFCLVVAVLQGYFFKFIDTNQSILILITLNILIQTFFPNVQIFNNYFVQEENEENTEQNDSEL